MSNEFIKLFILGVFKASCGKDEHRSDNSKIYVVNKTTHAYFIKIVTTSSCQALAGLVVPNNIKVKGFYFKRMVSQM